MNALIVRSNAVPAPVAPSAPPTLTPRLRLVRAAEAPAPQATTAAAPADQHALRMLITLRRSAPLAGPIGACAPGVALDRLVQLARRPG